jgi:hypothetical protein
MPGNGPRTEGVRRAAGVMQVPELIGGASGLGWIAVKAALFAVAVTGLHLGERRTHAQLSAFDFAVAVAIGAGCAGRVR